MSDNMIEIDVDEFYTGSVMTPYITPKFYVGDIIEIDSNIDLIGSKNGYYFRDPTKSGNALEIIVDIDIINNTMPSIFDWFIVTQGNTYEIPQGAQSPRPGDNMLMIDYSENTVTHTVNVINGFINSWVKEPGGYYPEVPNTHTIVMNRGLIQSWNIVSGGEKQPYPITHTVSIIDGLINNWIINS